VQDLIRIQLRGPASPKPVPLLVDAASKISSQMELYFRKLGLKPDAGDPAYDLHHTEGRTILNPALSLREAGVRENHVLVLLPRAVSAPEAPPPPPPRQGNPSAVDDFERAARAVRAGLRSPLDLDALLPAAQEAATSGKDKCMTLGTIKLMKLSAGLPWVVRQLRAAEAKVREDAIRVLHRLQAEDSAGEIRLLLSDPSGRVRGQAAETLARFGWEESAPAILAMLEDPDPQARAGATRALATMPLKGREARFLRLMEDGDPSVRAEAVESLARIDSAMLRNKLEDLFRDPEEEVRQAACRAAGELKLKTAIPSLLILLMKDEPVARAAMRALADLDAREASDLIRARLDEKYEWDQRDAIAALTRLGTVEPRDVARFATHRDSSLRAATVAALTKAKAGAELLPFLADANPEIQALACEAVGGPPELRRLRTFLSHRSPEVRATALHGLALNDVRDAVPEITPLLLDTDPRVRSQAVQALERFEYLPAARPIAALLGDEDASVRYIAAAALLRMGTPDLCSDLLPLLSHPQSRARTMAARLLQEFDARDAVPAIAALLRDPHPFVRGIAADRLARLGAETSAAAIRELLADPNRGVRWSAATALGSFGDSSRIQAALDPEREPESLSFTLLNGAKEPMLWKRLRDTRVASELSGPPSKIIAAIAEQAGVPVELSEEFHGRPAPSPEDFPPILPRSRMTLLTALSGTMDDHEFILEPGRIRLVRERDAAAEWMGWIGRL
jgi:HEAT repeat protein